VYTVQSQINHVNVVAHIPTRPRQALTRLLVPKRLPTLLSPNVPPLPRFPVISQVQESSLINVNPLTKPRLVTSKPNQMPFCLVSTAARLLSTRTLHGL
ncbi:hypothetical protein HDU99_006538, partial [Rhizoclosmatium hyalinum]